MGRLIDADKAIVLLNQRIDEHDKMMAKYEPYRNTQIPNWMWEGIIAETEVKDGNEQILADIHKNATTLREHGYDSVAIDAFEILVENIIHEYTKEQVDNTRPYYANEWL